MNRYIFIILTLLINSFASYAQQGWAMIKGGMNATRPVRATIGVADEKSNPGRRNGATWSYNGKLYLYGGTDGAGYQQTDMWSYDTLTGNWTWLSGFYYSGYPVPPVYGTKNISHANNSPGARTNAITWVLNGKLYLYGGWQTDPGYNMMDDLWIYDLTTNLWTWIGGNSGNLHARFGAQGVPTSTNKPGALGNAYAWERNGKLYLYGGQGKDSTALGFLNDVWEYDPTTAVWTWIKGDKMVGSNGHRGTKNVTDPADVPGNGSKACWYLPGKLYMMRHTGDEMWVYDHATNNWTWIKGGLIAARTVFGTKNVFDPLNTPGSLSAEGNWEYNGILYLKTGFYTEVLWAFDATSYEWSWVGEDTVASTAVYGAYRQADTTVLPKGLGYPMKWQQANKVYLIYPSQGNALWEYNHDTKMWRWIKGQHNGFSENFYIAEGIPHELNEPIENNQASVWQLGDTIYTYITFGGKNILWRYLEDKNIWSTVHVSYNTFPLSAGKGVGSVYNSPGERGGYMTGQVGRKLYLYGGGYIPAPMSSLSNELWEFDLDKKIWTLLKGDNTSPSPVMGTKGVANALNSPGAVKNVSMWSLSGKLYLFSNVLWEYNPQTNNWMWLKGDIVSGGYGVYGTKGVAAPTNQPGEREGAAQCLMNGKLYLATGYGMTEPLISSTPAYLNDMWVYDPATNNWTWLAGTKVEYPSTHFGTKGVAASGNTPGRRRYCEMAPVKGKIYLYGGIGSHTVNPFDYGTYPLDDFWEFDASTNFWTWIGGTQESAKRASYKDFLSPDTANTPGARLWFSAWSNGTKFYIYSGLWNITSDQENWTAGNGIWSYETCKDLSLCYASPPLVQMDSMLTICDRAVSLNAGNVGSRYLWSTSDTTQSITVRAPGKYWVMVTNPAGKKNADTTVVVAGKAPVFILADTILCEGDSVLISVKQATAARYRWNTLDTAADFYAFKGMYKVQVTGENGCYTIDSVSITTKPLPVKPRLGYNEPLCTGDKMDISDSALVQRDHGGLFGPKGFTGVTAYGYILNNITLSDAGIYYMVDTVNGCINSDTMYVRIDSVYTPMVNVTISPSSQTGPYVPLTFSANINYMADSTRLQWYKNGLLLPGETGKEYKATTNTDLAAGDVICIGLGVNLNCAIDTATGCAEPITIDLAVNEIKNNTGIVIMPNPVKDKLYIEKIVTGSIIKIYDNLGRVVFTKENTGLNEIIDMTDRPTGIYLLEIKDGSNKTTNIKLLKQ